MQKLILLIVFVPFVQLEYSKNGRADTLVNTPCTDQKHYLQVPDFLIAGISNRVCVSRVHSEEAAHLLLTLQTKYEEIITVRKELNTNHKGCVLITVPLFPNTTADLATFVIYPKSKCTWEKRMTVRIASGRELKTPRRVGSIPAQIRRSRIPEEMVANSLEVAQLIHINASQKLTHGAGFTALYDNADALHQILTSFQAFSSPCIDRNHLLLAPGVMTAGSSNRACISRFYSNGTAHLLLTLITADEEEIKVQRELQPGNGGCVDITAPMLPNTKADLITSLTYPDFNCTWERRVTLRIGSGRVVTVHTERARYRPGETLQARIFALKADLTPARGTIEEIWIEGPAGAWEGTRVAQWTRVRSKLGLAQIQHELDELAPPGKWTVRARLGDGSQGSASFLVGNYEIPPFKLTVRTAPRVLRTSERLVWTVCVRYPWTEAVEGMLVIRLRGADSPSAGIRTAVRLRAPRACHRHAAAAWRVGLMGDRPPSVVVADFSFQEDGTRVWQNTTVVSQVVDKLITLEFISKNRIIVTPSLPYSIKVKATLWDGKPAMNEHVRICRHTTESKFITCNSGNTGFTGVAKVFFTAQDHGDPVYRFEAHLVNDTSISADPITIATRRSMVQAALGTLRADSNDSKTYVPLYLSVQNVTSPITVHFVVITRGGIIHRWGATTQCPTSSFISQIDFKSQCNEPLPLPFEINLDKDENNIGINDYLNKFRREIAGSQNNKIVDKAESLYNSERESIRKNMNTKKLQEYYSRYMSQINKNNDSVIHDNKNKISNNNYNSVSDSFNDHSNFDDKSNKFKLIDNERQNDVNYLDADHASDVLQDSNLLKVLLPIKVTKQMCPDSHLFAYFYHEGEFVSAGKHFEMDDCFVDKVDLTWKSRQVLPGDMTSLKIDVQGPALCALTVTDLAAKLYPVETVKEIIVSSLKKMVANHRNLAEYDNAGDCSLDENNTNKHSSSLELTASWLSRAGVRAIGDMPLRRPCKPAAMTMPESLTVPRSDFSESWLWRLETVGTNGSIVTSALAPDSITRFEANAVCLTKMGISVAQPAILQVFREFFIHADSPKRLRHGDTTIIRYRLFNYLYTNLSVQIQILTNPRLQSRSDIVESVCIPPRSSNARRVEIVAIGDGLGIVYIRAKAVKDEGCGNIDTEARPVSDDVAIKITVEPEGIPVHEQKSTLLCGKDSINYISKRSEVSWTWPENKAIAGTKSLVVWAIGNITGPLLADADSLILLPRGCGEQNMARLATNLLALSHLHPTSPAAATAREHVSRGYTRQFQYIHPSGGFSAFGVSDPVASTWLTAFTVRYLRRAHKMLWPGLPIPQAIARAEDWLLEQQMENGCFRNEGQVFHSEFTGGINEEGETASVALTAYVITSLVEGTSPLPHRVVINSLSCLRALPPLKRSAPYRVYAQALLAYTFVRLIRYEEEIRRNNEASWVHEQGLKHNEGIHHVLQLINLASAEDDYLWWVTSSLSTSIEATSYALLALRESPVSLQEYGAGAVRWLASHRSASGGFISTQDTLVGLEAMLAWSSFQQVPADLNVTVTAVKTLSVHLDSETSIPEVMRMKGDTVKISVEGTGCALIQATRSYNTLAVDRTEHRKLSVKVQVHTDGQFDCDGENCYCAAVVEACVLWSGIFPEMALLEVTLPGGYEADAKRLYSQLTQPISSMLHRIEMSASSSRAIFYLTSELPITPRHSCFQVHAVGPRTETMPAHVRVFDYYRPNVNDTQVYTIPANCPPRIAHNTSEDIKDNVYNSARSLLNGEILISNDYDMEDTPEVVPLDDPLYENLRRHVNQSKTGTNANNRNLNTSETKRESKSMKENQTKYNNNNAGLVIDGKLDLGDDQKPKVNKGFQDKHNIENNQSTLKVQERINVISKVNVNNVENGKEGLVVVDTTKKGTEPHSLLEITNNNRKQTYILNSHVKHSENFEDRHKVAEEPQVLIEIGDSNGNHKTVEYQNFADFHVINSEKDLEVPSGIEGPVPSVVLPPPNFVPPTNFVPPPNFVPTTNFFPPPNYVPPTNFKQENSSPQNSATSFDLNNTPQKMQKKIEHYWQRVYNNWPQATKSSHSQSVPPNVFSPVFSHSDTIRMDGGVVN